MLIVDIHPHIISTDKKKYPDTPLFGIQSKWSQERQNPIENMLVAMDEAGVAKTAIVHASTCYGFDCSYLADSLARFPERCTGVGSIDMVAADNVKQAERWIAAGFNGFRIFTGGSTKEFDGAVLADPRSFPVWDLFNDKALSVCLQTDISAAASIVALAKRFPRTMIVLDHLGRPDVSDGGAYDAAKPLWDLAAHSNIFVKLTTHSLLHQLNVGKCETGPFLARLVKEFGANRVAWGSNFPATPGKLKEHVAMAQAAIAGLSEADREQIMGKTALKLYPALAR